VCDAGDKEKLDAALRLYAGQMDHYHKTQDVEWRGTLAAWAFSAGTLAATFQKEAHIGGWRLWSLLVLAIPTCHALWLRNVHASEEVDKKLWIRYREDAGRIAGLTPTPSYQKRTAWTEAAWLLVEAGPTLALGLALISRLF
jgi:hypothetical protein